MGCKTSKIPVIKRTDKKEEISHARRPSITSGVRLKQERSTINEYMVSLNEVRKVRDVYSGMYNGSILGTGNWGTVRVVSRKDDGKKFACKILRLSNKMSHHKVDELRTEINILAKLDHPYIAKLYEVYEDPGLNLYLIMELLEGGELYTKLTKNSTLGHYTEADAVKAVTQMFSAVSFLHENGIVHRDLKLENFVYRDSGAEQQLVLIDFGLSKRFDVDGLQGGKSLAFHDVVGSSYYIAPEVLEGNYGIACDMWSLGVITFMLLSGRPPFGGKDEAEIMKRALQGSFSFRHKVWDKVSAEAKDFVTRLLQKKPGDRMTAQQALQHPWLVQKRRESLEGSVLSGKIVRNIERYTQSNELRRLALNAVAYSLSREEVMDLGLAFESIDTDGNGRVTLEEFRRALEGSSKFDAGKMFEAMDLDHAGKIHLNEFLAAALSASDQLAEVNLLHAFERLDIEHTGRITVKNLKEILGANHSDEYVSSLVREFAGQGASGDAKTELDYTAFLRAMRAQPPYPPSPTPRGAARRRFPSEEESEGEEAPVHRKGGGARERPVSTRKPSLNKTVGLAAEA